MSIRSAWFAENEDNTRAATLDQYVNDRPYVLSSFLSVAMGRALGTAMTGRSKGRQELADHKIPLTATLAVVACRTHTLWNHGRGDRSLLHANRAALLQ